MANRYFVGAVDAHWNDVGNWDTISGGPGGASVPVAGDDAIFDGSSPNCDADANVTPDNIILAATFGNQLDLVTFNAALAGGISVAAGTMLFGSGTVTVTAAIAVSGGTANMESAIVTCHDVNLSGGTVTLSSVVVQVTGDADFNCATLNPGTGYLVFYPGHATVTFTTRGKSFPYVALNSAGTLLQVGDLTSLDLTSANAGTVWDTNDYDVTAAGNILVWVNGTLLGRSGTIRFGGTWSSTGGTWTPGTGTVEAWADAAHLAQQVTGATSFNNFTVGQTAPGADCTLTLTATVTVNGTLDLRGLNTIGTGGPHRLITGGGLHAKADVTCSNTTPVQGDTTVTVNGAVNQSVYWYAGTNFTVNKTGGTCFLIRFDPLNDVNDVTIALDPSVDLITGSVNNGYLSMYAYGGLNVTFVPLGGLTDLYCNRVWLDVYNCLANDAIDLGGLVVHALSNFEISHDAGVGGFTCQLNNGRIEFGGNLENYGWDHSGPGSVGTVVFRAVGAANAVFTNAGAWFPTLNCYWNPIEIAKTGGASITLAYNFSTLGAGQPFTVTSGVFDLAGFSLDVGGTFTVAAGATLRARGDEVIGAAARAYNAASNVVLYNAGVTALLNNLGTAFGNVDLGPPGKLVTTTAGSTISFAGSLSSTGTQANPVLIRSTVPGVQCFWTLTATGSSALGFTVDVMDNNAIGGLPIYAIGSVNRGNNVNWWFGTGGAQHPRLNFSHPFPEGFTGGLVPRDFLSYATGMSGMGAPGPGAIAPVPPLAAMLLAGLNGAASGQVDTADRGATWGPGIAAPFVAAVRSTSWWFIYNVNWPLGPVDVRRAPAASGPWTTVVIPATVIGGGWTWTHLMQLGAGGQLFVLANSAGVGTFLYRSADQGLTWVRGTNLVDGIGAFAPSFVWQSYAGTLLVAHPTLMLQRSTDLGDTWGGSGFWPANTGAPVMLGQAAPGARIWGLAAGTGPLAAQVRVIYSDDDGANWAGFTPATPGGMTNVGQTYFLVTRLGTLLAIAQDAGANVRVWRSTDGGNTWALAYAPAAGYTPVGIKQSLMLNNPLAIGLDHAATPRAALSDDDGATWTPTAGASAAPDNLTVLTLAVDQEVSR